MQTTFELVTSCARLSSTARWHLRHAALGLALAAAGLPAVSFAQQASARLNDGIQQGTSIKTTATIYGELISFSYPVDFKPAFESNSSGQYMQKFLLGGEHGDDWTEMVSVTGVEGLARNANVTPQLFVERIAAGFQKACPDSFAVQELGATRYGESDAFASVVACGSVARGTPHGESVVVMVVKGQQNYYTVQWAERDAESKQPPAIDPAKWLTRLKQLSPIRICAPKQSSPASCADQT
jgi:hypothetical protein